MHKSGLVMMMNNLKGSENQQKAIMNKYFYLLFLTKGKKYEN